MQAFGQTLLKCGMLFTSPPLQLAPDFWLLTGFAAGRNLLADIQAIALHAPFRHLVVPSGKAISVAMTNCGPLGWTSSARGYQYLSHDPATLQPWPAMPPSFAQLASDAAAAVGWPHYAPDACLVNRYAPGAGMGLHQDRDELDLRAPIVSVSIGASCKFILGGLQRSDPVQSVALHDGDVMVWGGQSRLVFHGVRPMPASGTECRYNLTFRKAGTGSSNSI
jgi:DNA oxidative demethylase